MTSAQTIYKVLSAEVWAGAGPDHVPPMPVDLADGFMHFSTRAQLAETLRRYFAGLRDVVLLAVDAGDFGDALRWEPSRGGDLFPHLYGALPKSAIRGQWRLDLPAEGLPDLPKDLPA